ncbi:MAG: methyltransferase domain-containing protein [Thermoleophilia bacterium]|nr:methyltransferase domain-containing protein [Thermoleophilia bacterium]
MIPPRLEAKLRATCRKAVYYGFRHKCPFCGSSLRAFLPFGFEFTVLKEMKVAGGGYRPNALCPVCSSLDRERLVYLFLLHKTDIFERPGRLLHVAPEARLAEIFRTTENLDYLTADISAKTAMVEMDITNIQFPDASFDVIICNHVLEHIIDDGKAMSELHRTLKPGGMAILQVPVSQALKDTYEDFEITDKAEREEVFGQGDHVRIYSSAGYQHKLARAGFKVNAFNWIAEPGSFGGKRNLFGLSEQEPVFLVRKYG